MKHEKMPRKRIHVWWIGLTALLLVLSLGVAMAGGGLLERTAMTASGGTVSQGELSLLTAVGQPVIGSVENGSTLCSGFLCSADAPPVSGQNYDSFIPMVTSQ